MPTEEKQVVEEQKTADTESPTAFGDAFREATNEVAEPVKEEAKEEVKEEKKEEKEVKEEAKEAETEVKKTDDSQWKHKYDTLQGMFNKMSKDFKAIKEQITQQKVNEEKKSESEPDDEEMTNFLTDYDYIANPAKKIIDRKAKEVEERILHNLNEHYTQTSRMVADLVISMEHPDFISLRNTGDIRGWVDSMNESPEKEEYTRICDEGNVEEVIQLLNDFKKATKKQKVVKEEDPVKQEKITNLTAVTTKRGAINAESGGKPASFSDAFKRHSAELEHRR